MSESPRVISVDTAGNVRSVEAIDARSTHKRLSRLAWLLDSSIPIPGTRLTIGLDAVIGFVPVLGDLIGVLLSSYILSEAARLGVPKVVLMRMALNVGVEGVLGSIPFVGDAFDLVWKANQRNVKLLNTWLDRPTATERSTRLFGLSLVFVVAVFFALLGVGTFFLLRWIFSLL